MNKKIQKQDSNTYDKKTLIKKYMKNRKIFSK